MKDLDRPITFNVPLLVHVNVCRFLNVIPTQTFELVQTSSTSGLHSGMQIFIDSLDTLVTVLHTPSGQYMLFRQRRRHDLGVPSQTAGAFIPSQSVSRWHLSSMPKHGTTCSNID